MGIYQDPIQFRDEIMTVYIWPFILVCGYATIGCLGNLLVLYVYFYKWSRTKTRFFILALTLVDFLNCSINMPIEAVILWNPMHFDHNNLCKVTRGMTFVLNDISACILVAIALDRVLCVYKPLKRRTLTMTYAKRSCIAAVCIGCCVGWPGFILYGTATLPEKLHSVTVLGKTCYISDEYLHTPWPFIFSIALFILMILVFLTLTLMYILIGRKLYRVSKGYLEPCSSRRKATLESLTQPPVHNDPDTNCENTSVVLENVVLDTMHQKKLQLKSRRMSRRVSGTNLTASRDNTVTMAMVTIAFMVSFLPYLIIVTLRYINSQFYFDLDKNEKIVYHVFLRQYFLNSVINSFIYSYSNKHFRLIVVRTFKTLLVRCRLCT